MLKKINGKLVFFYDDHYSPARKKRLYIKFIPLLAVLMGVFLWTNTAYLSEITADKLIELTNNARTAAGLKPLTLNSLLTKAAQAKGKSILSAQEFKHNIGDRKFSSWIKEVSYDYSYVGENLAIDFVTSEGIIDAWLNSPSHKQNVLNASYEEIGMAAVRGDYDGQETTVVVQIFGTPAEKNEPANKNAAIPLSRPAVLGENINYQITEPISETALSFNFPIINYRLTPLAQAKINLVSYQANQGNLLTYSAVNFPPPIANGQRFVRFQFQDSIGLNNFFEQGNYLISFYNLMAVGFALAVSALTFYLYSIAKIIPYRAPKREFIKFSHTTKTDAI